ncbi:hypothetical protein [Treponema sp. R6D11]
MNDFELRLPKEREAVRASLSTWVMTENHNPDEHDMGVFTFGTGEPAQKKVSQTHEVRPAFIPDVKSNRFKYLTQNYDFKNLEVGREVILKDGRVTRFAGNNEAGNPILIYFHSVGEHAYDEWIGKPTSTNKYDEATIKSRVIEPLAAKLDKELGVEEVSVIQELKKGAEEKPEQFKVTIDVSKMKTEELLEIKKNVDMELGRRNPIR